MALDIAQKRYTFSSPDSITSDYIKGDQFGWLQTDVKGLDLNFHAITL
jgi:hypothetical protein